MKKLDRKDVTVQRCDPSHVIVCAHENDGYRHYTKVALADSPNDLVSRDDLERLGIVPHSIDR